LSQILAERDNREALAEAGLPPAKSVLLVGPPGVGKTLSARWLAARLGLPLITLDLAAVMSSYLGRTGSNLRNVLDYAKGVDCILLLDEFDAIAKRRDDAVEVGELKRLVTVLLQEIDQWPASGLLVAATNHPELLDPAVWRRFDVVVQFSLPGDELTRKALVRLIGNESPALIDTLTLAMRGMSFSDIEREILRSRRQSVLRKQPIMATLEAFVRSAAGSLPIGDRKALAMALIAMGYTQRQTHELTGVSRDTIRRHENLSSEDT